MLHTVGSQTDQHLVLVLVSLLEGQNVPASLMDPGLRDLSRWFGPDFDFMIAYF